MFPLMFIAVAAAALFTSPWEQVPHDLQNGAYVEQHVQVDQDQKDSSLEENI